MRDKYTYFEVSSNHFEDDYQPTPDSDSDGYKYEDFEDDYQPTPDSDSDGYKYEDELQEAPSKYQGSVLHDQHLIYEYAANDALARLGMEPCASEFIGFPEEKKSAIMDELVRRRDSTDDPQIIHDSGEAAFFLNARLVLKSFWNKKETVFRSRQNIQDAIHTYFDSCYMCAMQNWPKFVPSKSKYTNYIGNVLRHKVTFDSMENPESINSNQLYQFDNLRKCEENLMREHESEESYVCDDTALHLASGQSMTAIQNYRAYCKFKSKSEVKDGLPIDTSTFAGKSHLDAPEKKAEEQELISIVENVIMTKLRNLTPLQRQVVRMKLGLSEHGELRNQDIIRLLNGAITQKEINALYNKAKQRLRHSHELIEWYNRSENNTTHMKTFDYHQVSDPSAILLDEDEELIEFCSLSGDAFSSHLGNMLFSEDESVSNEYYSDELDDEESTTHHLAQGLEVGACGNEPGVD